MSLLSRLPYLFLGLALVLSSAAQSTPSPAPAPAAAAGGRKFTAEQLAAKPVGALVKQCALIMKLDFDAYKLRDARSPTPPTAAEMVEHRKTDAAKRAAAWKEINAVQPAVANLLLDPQTKALATPAVEFYKATRQLNDLHQQLFPMLDSGKPESSREVQAILEKATPLAKLQSEQIKKAAGELKRVLGELTADAQARVDQGPAPAPAGPGSITPGKKESELPPGMTRTRK